jgi:hypothetical protein
MRISTNYFKTRLVKDYIKAKWPYATDLTYELIRTTEKKNFIPFVGGSIGIASGYYTHGHSLVVYKDGEPFAKSDEVDANRITDFNNEQYMRFLATLIELKISEDDNNN